MFDALQLLGGIILSIGYIPQIIKLIKTKSAKDFNLKTFMSVLIGIALMEVYAIDLFIGGSGFMYLITNTMSLVIQIILVALICKYQYKSKKQEG